MPFQTTLNTKQRIGLNLLEQMSDEDSIQCFTEFKTVSQAAEWSWEALLVWPPVEVAVSNQLTPWM